MNLILFGFKGVGKTFLGKKMALELGRPFYDTDEMIEFRYKRSVREIFREVGEAQFRKIENEILNTLKNLTNSIIAVGGGTVTDPENLQIMQQIGKLIYLKTSFEMILERILKTGIPSFIDPENLVANLKILYEKRSQFYETIPAQVIEL
jgi:shikimate kinase